MSRFDLLSSYDYSLPDELIAKEPLPQRDASRLMVLTRTTQTIEHLSMRDLPNCLSCDDCLVLNNSRVLPARLIGFRTATGGKWEGLYLNSTEHGHWRMIGQTRGYLRPNETITFTASGGETLLLKLLKKEADGVCVYEPSHSATAVELLQTFGTVPLPPYMDRKLSTALDQERYQTTYALHPGSVAAPTAGLHFTPELLQACRLKGVQRAEVTLHVGIGTFRPVAVEELSLHKMHSEWCEFPAASAAIMNSSRKLGGRIVAVGTTSLRTLESERQAQSNLNAEFQEWRGETSLFVRPPYQFKSADNLLTNFHLPKSTLLMLVSAFAGLDFVLEAYREAVGRRYRFFSYGDAMLIR